MEKTQTNPVAESRLTLVGLSGSLRSGSFNRAALNAAAELLPPTCVLAVHEFRNVPVFDADEQARGIPAGVLALADAMRSADGVVIASPEYNFSIPGRLKNLIDWLSRLPDQPFKHKPVALMGTATGPLGTARMQYDLRRVLHCLEAQVLLKPEIFVGHATGKFDANGTLTDEPTRQLLKQQMAAFETMIRSAKRSEATST
ncbi:MAG: NADPH-dependent FMN reductase [Hydrogenophaga sp.]